MICCNFGENLKSLRKSKNLTQKELGNKIGLSKAVISKYENGIGYPSYDILIRIAHYFGVSTDYLLGVSGNKTVEISGLTDFQADMIQQIVAEFNRINNK